MSDKATPPIWPEWRPISEAPFDQMIVLFCPGTDPQVTVGCCCEDSGWLALEYDMMTTNCRPTHWLPLPPSPKD